MLSECTETVSILYAIVFGVGDACVLISMPSILSALGVFFVLVIIAQFVARKMWARMKAPRTKPSVPPADQPVRGAIVDDPKYADSAIRSNRR